MLRNSSSFAGSDLGRTNGIEQRCFSMVYVAHNRYYRRTRQFDIVGGGGDQLFEFFLGHHFFKGNEGDVVTKSLTEIRSDVIHQRLIDRRKHTTLPQKRHDILWLDPQLLGELFDG